MKLKRSFRILALLQVFCLVFVLLSGCASSTKENEKNKATEKKKTTKKVEVKQKEANQSKGLEISVSLPIIPPLITEQKTGAIVDLVKAMADEYKEGKINLDVYPMARSMENVMGGTADCHCPYIKNHNITDSDNVFYYTTEQFGMVLYVLYTNKNVSDLTPKNVTDKKFKIEIQPGNKEYLGDFPESAPDAGLQKIDSGRIDGYICAMDVCDPLLKQLQLKNVKRQLHDSFETAIIFKKDDAGKKKQEIMNSLIKKIKETGAYDKIMGEINKREVFVPDPQ